MKTYIYTYITCLTAVLMMLVSCTSEEGGGASVVTAPTSIGFTTYVNSVATRATYPSVNTTPTVGAIDSDRLKTTAFGVFAQHTSEKAWTSYTAKSTTAFNFMWNQQVTWDTENSFWTYSPVKYWPNDNQPADDQTPASQGSLAHSYLSFFAYAPYVQATDLPGHSDATADGIVEMSANNASADNSYIYYRTSNEKPFAVDESVDLLWASQRDRYKMDGGGYTDGTVDFMFKHALTKLNINVRAMVDRTANNTSPAYSTEVDDNTRIFIDNVSITTPAYYPEGMLKIASDNDTPVWDYTGVTTVKNKFRIGSDVNLSLNDVNVTKDIDNVNYSMRYADPNVPVDATITDTDGDGIDDNTGLTLVETARTSFDEMMEGVTSTEQQLAAQYSTFMFCPSTETHALSVTAVYHVVTFDPNLTLNDPKFYSDVSNNITAELGNDDFKFESNKQYKIMLNLGITSVKFEVSVLDDSGEWILLSAVVKEWDLKTIEADVK